MPASADSKNKRVASGSPATHQSLRQEGGSGEDGYIHLADKEGKFFCTETIKLYCIVLYCRLDSQCRGDREEEELLRISTLINSLGC